ncbi:MAG: universal stress protein [Pseudomonadota bacterium]|nr:universal stress protein [Pseudomonadota bacterium]MEE3101354.1 universal stress protein [Pseudomonadota bacterium]
MRKFLVVVDETPECMNAIRFAARRAKKTGGGLQMMFILRPTEFQHWMGVQDIMRQEARDAAEARFQEVAGKVTENVGIYPEFVIREGEPVEEVLAQIKEDPEIGVLVLGAGVDNGPGPLVSHLVGKLAGNLPLPVTVVPGALSRDQVIALA